MDKKNIRTWLFYLLLQTALASLAWFYFPQFVLAGPPAPLSFTLVQPDGATSFEARAWGDQAANGVETVAGYTLLQDRSSGYWFYADVDPTTGQLTATDLIAGKDPPPASAFNARPLIMSAQETIAAQGAVGVPTVPVLLLMVQYSSRPAISTESDWIQKFFGTSQSVQDYYQEISYHQFMLSPAIESCGVANDGLTSWLTLGTTHPNAGGPSIALAALTMADSCVDYAAFDRNGDDQITPDELLPIIIVAGYENSYGGDLALTPNVWAHQAAINYNSVDDRVTVKQYAQFGEWHATTWDNPGHQATIGLIVHEIGHLLGWPDLYDNLPPGNPDSEGVGDWSVMGTGLWLGTTYFGDSPAHPSAWEKWYQSWLQPRQMQGSFPDYAIASVEDDNQGTVIQLMDNPQGVDWSFGEHSGSGEFFLLENRQQIGYDTALPGCGLLIWHIDEGVVSSNWANSDEDHKLVDLAEADGFDHLDHMLNRGDSGDPYPGSANNRHLTDRTHPHSRLYNGQPSGVSITNISGGCGDTKTVTLTAPYSIRLAKGAKPNPVSTGGMLTYTLVVTNYGSTAAGNVVITDTVPAHTTLNVASLSSNVRYTGLEPGSIITWPPQLALAPGEFLTRTFTVRVDLGVGNQTAIVNSAHLSEGSRFDSSSTTVIVAAPDLNAAIEPDPTPIEPATTAVSYTITVANKGASAATNVTITNTIPDPTTYVTGSASHGGDETTPGSGLIAWPATTIQAGSTITRTFEVTPNSALYDGQFLANILSINSAQGIKIENLEQRDIVGIQRIYLPTILK